VFLGVIQLLLIEFPLETLQFGLSLFCVAADKFKIWITTNINVIMIPYDIRNRLIQVSKEGFGGSVLFVSPIRAEQIPGRNDSIDIIPAIDVGNKILLGSQNPLFLGRVWLFARHERKMGIGKDQDALMNGWFSPAAGGSQPTTKSHNGCYYNQLPFTPDEIPHTHIRLSSLLLLYYALQTYCFKKPLLELGTARNNSCMSV